MMMVMVLCGKKKRSFCVFSSFFFFSPPLRCFGRCLLLPPFLKPHRATERAPHQQPARKKRWQTQRASTRPQARQTAPIFQTSSPPLPLRLPLPPTSPLLSPQTSPLGHLLRQIASPTPVCPLLPSICGDDMMWCGDDMMWCGDDMMRCGDDMMRCGDDMMWCGDDMMRCGDDMV